MYKLSILEIAQAVNGRLTQGAPAQAIEGVATDSRHVLWGELFFALKGGNFDGHAFISEVEKKGACGAVVDEAWAREARNIPSSFGLIVVKDTTFALGELAAHARRLYKNRLLAISGSAGKTTTKEMAASILSRSRKVLKTEGNKNNLIGVPLTLFRLDPSIEAAVIELGISIKGEMERLVEICSPDVALITNIGRSHLEHLGSIDGVAKAKGPLFTALGPGKIKVVNLDDPWAVRLAGDQGERITFSDKVDADVKVAGFSDRGLFSGIEAEYDVRGRRISVVFRTPGYANVINGAAAIAATLPFDVAFEDIKEGLESYRPVHGRMEIVSTGFITILDDAYNANPDSMAASLRTLSSVKGRKVAIIGEMLELGEASQAEHVEAGRLAASLGTDVIIAIGERAGDLAFGALEAGEKGVKVFVFGSKKEALPALSDILKQGDTALVKASRGARLEEVVEALKGINRPAESSGV